MLLNLSHRRESLDAIRLDFSITHKDYWCSRISTICRNDYFLLSLQLVDPRPPFPLKGTLNRMLLLAPIGAYALIEVSTD